MYRVIEVQRAASGPRRVASGTFNVQMPFTEKTACTPLPLDPAGFNENAVIPFGCSVKNIQSAMQDKSSCTPPASSLKFHIINAGRALHGVRRVHPGRGGVDGVGKALKRHAAPISRAVPMGQASGAVAANLEAQDAQLSGLVPAQHMRTQQAFAVTVPDDLRNFRHASGRTRHGSIAA